MLNIDTGSDNLNLYVFIVGSGFGRSMLFVEVAQYVAHLNFHNIGYLMVGYTAGSLFSSQTPARVMS